jgi:hypothetical protein
MADLVRAHHLLTTEVLRRTVALRRQADAETAPVGNTPGMITLPSTAARLLAVEVLLAEPEARGFSVMVDR